MEEILPLIVRGCEKARNLEENLPSVASQTDQLLASCKAIAAYFSNAVEKLASVQAPGPGRRGEENVIGSECMVTPYLDYPLVLGERRPAIFQGAPSERAVDPPKLGLETPAKPGLRDSGEDKSLSGCGMRSSPVTVTPSVQRPTRKRKDICPTRTKRVPAAPGNLDAPPDDGHTWRKYGQKNILQSRFPRSYYRCTHKNFYGCEAKKQVQRLDDDPNMYEVTYCGDHSCQTSPTPYPIMNDAIASGREVESAVQAQCSVADSISALSWYSINVENMKNDVSLGGETSGASHRKQSHLPAGRDLECTVAEFADVMFNPRGGYILDALFSSKPQD